MIGERRPTTLAAVCITLTCSCAGDPRDEQATASAPPTTQGADGQTDPSQTSAQGEGSDDGLEFDLGLPPNDPDVPGAGCAGIDFLFVIDNSGSMDVQQGQLLASFPGFISAIEASLEEVDSFHVGVITSDDYVANDPGCSSLGDLVTQTQGSGACGPFLAGSRFATDDDELGSVFPCMAQVGTMGSPIERPVSAAVAALSPPKLAAGGCNEGFLRDDAILVLVIVTDDPPFFLDVDDAHPDTDTVGWNPAILAAKGGDPGAVVVIGFVPIYDLTCVLPGMVASPNLIDFVTSFGPQGAIASVCEPDFGPIFADTIETITSTCDNFVPQG